MLGGFGSGICVAMVVCAVKCLPFGNAIVAVCAVKRPTPGAYVTSIFSSGRGLPEFEIIQR